MSSILDQAEVASRKAMYERELGRLEKEIPGLDRMIAEFQVRSRATQWYVLASPDDGLNGLTPAQCLRRVMVIIRGYGEQGAA